MKRILISILAVLFILVFVSIIPEKNLVQAATCPTSSGYYCSADIFGLPNSGTGCTLQSSLSCSTSLLCYYCPTTTTPTTPKCPSQYPQYCPNIDYCTSYSYDCNNYVTNCGRYRYYFCPETLKAVCVSNIPYCTPTGFDSSTATNCGGSVYFCKTGEKVQCSPLACIPTPTPTPTPQPFTISGNVFLDNNENKAMDPPESCYTGGVTVAVYAAGGGATDFYNFPTGCNYLIPKQYTDPPKMNLYLKDIPSGYFTTIVPTNIGSSNSTNANIGIKQITTVTGAHKRVFVTSQVYQGNLGGLLGADQKCQERANAKNLGGTWKAWLSDDNTSASSRLNHDSIPYALLNGQQIAGNWNDLTDGNLDIPINVDENSNKVSSLVWSGTETNGITSAQSGFKCKNWTSADDIYGHNGSSTSTNYYWTNSGFGRCWQQARLYCFDQGQATTQLPTPTPTPTLTPTPTPTPPPGLQASGSCGTGTARATELVSTPQFAPGSKFPTSGACVVNPKAAFVPFKIPTYGDLKSVYFDQLKSARKSTISPGTNPANQGNLNSAVSPADTQKSIFVDGDLHISGNLTFNNATIPIVVFVKDNLTILSNITYGVNSSSAGLVFVVGKDIAINTNVSEINAILISQETIYTGGGGCTNPSVTTNQLIINGSLVSLNPDKPIKFCRSLNDNTQPAEKINHQVKYLILLRHLLSDTIQRWSEIP